MDDLISVMRDASAAAEQFCFDGKRVEGGVRSFAVALAAIAAQWAIVRLTRDLRPRTMVGRGHRFAVTLLIATASIQIAFLGEEASRYISVERNWSWLGEPRLWDEDVVTFFTFTVGLSFWSLLFMRFNSPRPERAAPSDLPQSKVAEDDPALEDVENSETKDDPILHKSRAVDRVEDEFFLAMIRPMISIFFGWISLGFAIWLQ